MAKILLVGGGGREHALAWKLVTSPRCDELVVAPGNPGIGRLPKVRVAAVRAEDTVALVALARAAAVDLVVCGPEGPLAAGLGDAMRAAGFAFFGPSRAAAEIEGSKAFAKQLMAEAGVPTAAFGVFEDVAAAERFIDAQPGPVVVKADGLCAGKGVVVADTRDESKAAVRRMLADGEFGAAGARVVLEERLYGREVSMMALCDGERIAMLASAEDHKAVFDGDRGPNTGGMGTYSPSPRVDAASTRDIIARIFDPTVAALRAQGRTFRGLLYGGLILTRDRGPMVIEWNCRFGDPETQVVMARMQDDLLPWLEGAAVGRLPDGEPRFVADAAVCVVLAAANYPGTPRAGDPISLGDLDAPPGEKGPWTFHAGTRWDAEREQLVTAGGRVLGIVARGSDLAAARSTVYSAMGTGPGQIGFAGMHFRTDIGTRGDA
ncbi:MAG TPA: phosphoribosylamine--glycine ligase [Polyangia bacterium]|jgi:phosphoribosylamine--glycine ligase